MSLFGDLTALAREVKEMLVALRDLAREMRAAASLPGPHPLDASPLPTFEEACKGMGEEAKAWDDLAKQCEPLPEKDAPPASGVSTTASEAGVPSEAPAT